MNSVESPKVIGPGYRLDPPPKVVGPACNGDCGCSGCKDTAPADAEPSVVGLKREFSSGRSGIVQLEPSSATLATLSALNTRPAPRPDGAPDQNAHSSALCWSAKVVDALAEQALTRYRWESVAKVWTPQTEIPRPRLVLPGDRSRVDLATLHDGVGVSLRWILMGGLSIDVVRREER